MKNITVILTLLLKGFWLSCLMLAFGHSVQATPPCHEMAETKEACNWCDISTNILDETALEVEALQEAVVKEFTPVYVFFFKTSTELVIPESIVFTRGPPDQIYTSTNWFTDTIRLRV